MIRTINLLIDRKRSSEELFGFRPLSHNLKQGSQIVDGLGSGGVFRSESFFLDGKRSSIEWLSFGIFPYKKQHSGVFLECFCEQLWVRFSVGFSSNCIESGTFY